MRMLSQIEITEVTRNIRSLRQGETLILRDKDIYDYVIEHGIARNCYGAVVYHPLDYNANLERKNNSGNPKDLIGSTKVPLNLVPAAFIAETSLAFLEGKLKYGEVNWRAAPVRTSIYLDALLRHICKYAEGEDRDTKSRVHHLGNAGACLGIIIDAALAGTLIDDRKMSNPNAIEQMDKLSDTVKHLQELFKDSHPKHFTKENSNEAPVRPLDSFDCHYPGFTPV